MFLTTHHLFNCLSGIFFPFSSMFMPKDISGFSTILLALNISSNSPVSTFALPLAVFGIS